MSETVSYPDFLKLSDRERDQLCAKVAGVFPPLEDSYANPELYEPFIALAQAKDPEGYAKALLLAVCSDDADADEREELGAEDTYFRYGAVIELANALPSARLWAALTVLAARTKEGATGEER